MSQRALCCLDEGEGGGGVVIAITSLLDEGQQRVASRDCCAFPPKWYGSKSTRSSIETTMLGRRRNSEEKSTSSQERDEEGEEEDILLDVENRAPRSKSTTTLVDAFLPLFGTSRPRCWLACERMLDERGKRALLRPLFTNWVVVGCASIVVALMMRTNLAKYSSSNRLRVGRRLRFDR